MIRVTLRNYDTNEEIYKFDYSAHRGEKEDLWQALRFVENLQKEQDVLGLGRPCFLKVRSGYLGITSFSSKGVYSTTKSLEAPDEVKEVNSTFIGKPKYNEKEPDELLISSHPELNREPYENTGIRITASSYMCGLVLNTGRQFQGGFLGMGGTQDAYFIKNTSTKTHSGAKSAAKKFDSPAKVKKLILNKRNVFEYLVKSHGYNFSVEYTCEEYKHDVMSMDEKKRKKWDREMQDLELLLKEINNLEQKTEYATEAAKKYVEWANSNREEMPPAPITTDDMKAEAVYRMKKLGMWDKAIDAFKDGKVMQSEALGIMYDISNEAKEIIDKLETSGYIVYSVIKTESRDLGTIYDCLYVSKCPEEWAEERCSNDGYVPSACISDATFGNVEFGDIKIVSVNGGLKRVG